MIVASRELDADEIKELPEHYADHAYVLEHQKIPYISYPYEWCFGQLRAAALHHLELQIEAFASGLSCSDASAYNIQFIGGKPVFIDILSLRPYKEGEYWQGYTQFCRQFLYPLLLQAKTGLPFNCLYRGNMEGITAKELSIVLPWHKKAKANMLLHVSGVAALETRLSNVYAARKMYDKTLRPSAYHGFLTSLRNWIAKLKISVNHGTWHNYEQTQSYEADGLEQKRNFVTAFMHTIKPAVLYDLGCNTGHYSILASSAGARYTVGYDSDPASINIAYQRIVNNTNVLPLVMDAANPTPSMGWSQEERPGFKERSSADAFIALAFAHHLCLSRNVPLDNLMDWLSLIATRGILEFVPKEDPTVQTMLATRDDIFHDYSKDNFEQAMRRQFSIRDTSVISRSGRTLYWLERN